MVMHMVYARFEADKDIMDPCRASGKKREGRLGDAAARVLAPVMSLQGCADDGRGISQSPEHLDMMIVVIVTVCPAFGLSVSKAKIV